MASLIGDITNRQIIVEVWLSIPIFPAEGAPDNEWIPIKALIDTGATASAVSSKATLTLLDTIAERRPATSFTFKNIVTASDTVRVPQYDVNIALGILQDSTYRKNTRNETNWIFHTLDVTVFPGNENFDMLIGMDFLQHCHLSMSKGIFILSN